MPGSEFDFSSDEETGVELGSEKRPAPKRKAPENSTTAATTGRRKKQKTKAARQHDDDHFDLENAIDLRLGRMNDQLLSDHWARQIQRFEPDIDTITLEDKRLPVSAIIDTSGWNQLRDINGLPNFIQHFSNQSQKELTSAPKSKGCPHTIVIAAAGIRAADLTRTLRVFQSKDILVAKMFAKHIKLQEAIDLVKKSRLSFGVGTPQRIEDILESGTLSLDHLRRIIVDASWINAKKRSILDQPETQVPLSRLLSRPDLKARYDNGKTQILMY